MKLKLSHFDFNLPPELLATEPILNRDESKMMVVHRKSGKIEHKKFKDILDYFTEDDVMILNNTKVIPARLYGNKEKTGAKIEVFLMRELSKVDKKKRNINDAYTVGFKKSVKAPDFVKGTEPTINVQSVLAQMDKATTMEELSNIDFG